MNAPRHLPDILEGQNADDCLQIFREAEYRSMSSASTEIIWLHSLLLEFRVFLSGLIPLYIDNTSDIQIAMNPIFHEQTKHIEVWCHFICQYSTLHLPQVSSNISKLIISS